MNEKDLMRKCFELARKGAGKVSPNPMVGAVIVKGGKIIGQGYHHEYGSLHAERDAFNNLTIDPSGARLFVNLEPCSHHGKQPPCVDAIIEHGIKEVYISNIDTNPKVDGLARLRESGIEVHTGILEEEGKKLNEVFFFNMKYQRPLVSLKYAMTLDGKIATKNRDSKWISGEASRRYVHQLRSDYDAILIGSATAKADNPSLNSRIEGGIDPVRIIVDSKLSLDPSLKIFNLESDKKTYIATCIDTTNPYKAELIRCKSKNGRVDITDLVNKLYELGIRSILVEGGSTINESFLKAGLVDKVYAFVSPKIAGGSKSISPIGGSGVDFMKDAYQFRIENVQRFDEDLMIEAKNVYWHI